MQRTICLATVLTLGLAAPTGASAPLPAAPGARAAALASLPIAFEPNLGQTDAEVGFLARGRGYGLFLTGTEAVLALGAAAPRAPRRRHGRRDSEAVHGSPGGPAVVRMRFLDASPASAVVGLEPLPGRSNYLLGQDPRRWHTGIPQYARVEYAGLYPGVDLVFHGGGGMLEYDFVVAPGADPGAIRLGFDGVTGLHVDGDGNLVLEVEGGEEVLQKRPVSYEEAAGRRTPVQARYVLLEDCAVGFAVPGHDRDRRLVIDPVLVYSTYLGGDGFGGDELGYGVAVDASGSAYVSGRTNSSGFPTQGPVQAAFAGSSDGFVAKINAAGSVLVYSTYLGGGNFDASYAIAVDGAGNAHVAGFTYSTDFPTLNPLQAVLAGASDAFLAKLNPSGSALVYSTYLGGLGDDLAFGIALDGGGNVHATGYTGSLDFPVRNPLQAANAGARDTFVAKLDPAGSALVYSTYLGGSNDEFGWGIAVDGTGNAYIAGETYSTDLPTRSAVQAANAGLGDAFVARLNPTGSALVYLTYLGGSGDDRGYAIATYGAGNAVVTGVTASTNFRTQSPLQSALAGQDDAFVAGLAPTGASLAFSTYLGGNDDDHGNGIAVDGAGNTYVTGETYSRNFPSSGVNAGYYDAFVAKLDPPGSALVYSRYLGGREDDFGNAIAIDAAGSVFIAGGTYSSDFPTQGPIQPLHAGDGDVFVTRLNPAGNALVYSTFLGAPSHEDFANCIAVDGAGNAYVAGETTSNTFPTVGPIQATNQGGYGDVFVAKVDPGGAALLYSTYLGGTAYDTAYDIAVDGAGNAYVTGETDSTDFPTAGPLQPASAGLTEGFVAKLDASGATLVFSTYLGGSDYEGGYGIAVDGAGSAYVTGGTYSADFPTMNALQPLLQGVRDTVIAKLAPGGGALVYSTFLGGTDYESGYGIAVDGAGSVYVAGGTDSADFPTRGAIQAVAAGATDAFVAKVDAAGAALVYSTYLGGSLSESAYAIAVDGTGRATVTGYTRSPDFPTVNPLQPANAAGQDVFVARLDAAGSALVYSTYLGGNSVDLAYGIAVDATGNAYVAGYTESTDFPTRSPLQGASAGSGEAFLAKVAADGSALVHATYLGGSGYDYGNDVAVGAGSVYVVGSTESTDFPTLGGIRSTSTGGYDAFVARIDECLALPGAVPRLKGRKALPTDVYLAWAVEPLAAAGYRVYAVAAKVLVPTANVGNTPACVAPAGQLDCTDGGGLGAPPDLSYYQVVGVCADGSSEGAL